MFITLGLRSFSPLLFAALRFDVVAVLLLAVAAARRRGPLLPHGPSQWTIVLVAGALMTGAYHAFLFWGQQETSPGIAAVIVGLSPTLTTVFSRALLHDERVGPGGILGLALGLLGIAVLAALKPGPLLDPRGLAELAVVVAIASWAMGSVLVKRSKHGMEVLSFSAWQALVGAVLLHLSSLALEGRGKLVLDGPGVASLLYLSVVSSALGFIIYFTLVEHVGPIRVNLVSNLAPIFATASGFLVLDVDFEWRAIPAFLLIVSGFYLVARPARPLGETGAPMTRTSQPEEP